MCNLIPNGRYATKIQTNNNLIAPIKDMSDLWIICCVFCCFAPIECQTISILEKTTNWFTAFQTCKMLHGRLPGVNISNYQLELEDRSVTKNISSPFWIGATYDFLDINVVKPRYGYVYPYTCCERIQNFDGTRRVECLSCSDYNAFLCAISTNEISADGTTSSYPLWQDAFQVCKGRNLSLPKRENAQFLNKVTPVVGPFWLDGISQINFNPEIGIQNRNCLQSLIGRIQEGKCYDTSMTTVCIFDNNISGSEQNTYTPPINTESPSNAGSLQTKTSEAEYIISTSKPTESMEFQTTTKGTIATSPNIHETFTNSTNMATNVETMIGKGAVIGGVVGSVVGTIVITVVIVVLVRNNRSGKDDNDQTEHHVRAHNQEIQSIFNSCYGVRRNASLEKRNIETPNQAEASTDIYSQPQKHKVKEQQSSDNGTTVENTNERVVSVFYSVVRKDLKSNYAPNSGKKIKGSEDNDEEYDKLSHCSKSNQLESSGNVYDKANFKHHDNSEYDTTYNINISIDTAYDHVQ